MKVLLTGEVRIENGAAVLGERRLPGRQGRLVLAYLAAEQGRPVPRDELAEAIWGATPPETWEKALAGIISKLRDVLDECGVDGARALTHAFGCYRLTLPEDSWIDVAVAEAAVTAAAAALERGDPAAAKAAAAEAAAITGRPFLPGEDGEWVEGKRRQLRDLHVRALECLADASLALAAPDESARWAGEAVELEPFRETAYRRVMVALAKSGNHAEALRVYERCRQLLAHELGTAPAAETQALHIRILKRTGEPSRTETVAVAEAHGHGSPRLRRSARAKLLVIAGCVVLAAPTAAIVAHLLPRSARIPAPVAANSLASVDPRSGRVVSDVAVGARPAGVSYGFGSLWVANQDDRTVSRVDLGSGSVVRTIPVRDAPLGLAATKRAVWTAGVTSSVGRVTVRRIDPTFDAVSKTFSIPSFPGGSAAIAAGPDALWVAPSLGLLTRVDPTTGARLRKLDVRSSPTAVAAARGTVWVADQLADTVTRVDRTGALVTVPVGHGPSAIAIGEGAVWVVDTLDDTLLRIDPETNAVTATIRVGDTPSAVAVGAGAVWVANSRSGTISQVDPVRFAVARTIRIGGTPAGMAFGDGRLWVTVQPNVLAGADSGSVRPDDLLRVNSQVDFDSLDPPLAFLFTSWQVEYATCAKLLNYPDRSPPQGSRLEPEVAEALPTRSQDGKTYTFTIRPGYRFSPPSNQPVSAETFKYSIERALNPRLKSPARLFAADIVGMRAYEAGKASHIAGLTARGTRLTVELTRRSGDLPARLALPFFCAVPVGTPVDPRGLRSVPSAGPYYVSSYAPGQGLVLRRNPNYRGPRPHGTAEIRITTRVARATSAAQIAAGQADYALDGVPHSLDARLTRRYGRGAERRYFAHVLPSTLFLALNTTRGPFNDVSVRRAANYAIDRTALARLGTFSNLFPGAPTDQYLPPGIPGFRDVHLYPLRPDAAAARRLMHGRRMRVVLYTCDVSPCPEQAQIIKSNLGAIGLHVQIRTFPLLVLFGKIATRGEPFDLATIGWQADYPDPADFLNLLLDGNTIQAKGNVNYAYLNEPKYNRKLRAAAGLIGPRRYETYARLDEELARDAAPWVAVANPTERDFFSTRVGCQLFNPIYGIDLAALCTRADSRARRSGSSRN